MGHHGRRRPHRRRRDRPRRGDRAGHVHLRRAGARPAGPTLHTGFRGVLNDKLVGFYRSTFTDDDGAEQVIATTQFEATDARRAFPCWDEPDLKAVFAVTLVVDADLLAVSNAAEVGPPSAARRRAATRSASPTPWSCPPTWWRSSSARSRPPTPVDVDGTPLRVVVPAGQGPPHRLRPRGRRVLPALLRRLLRHRLPGRQARPGRRPRLRLRGHGEPRLRHLPRDRSCSSTRPPPPRPSCRTSPTSSPTSSPTCGSATS